jgi:hypothetical protein
MKTVFHYMIENRRRAMSIDDLDRLGDVGWELVAVVPDGRHEFVTYFFKRAMQVVA